MLFSGSSDLITLVGNYIHNCSGRAPKVNISLSNPNSWNQLTLSLSQIGGAGTSNIVIHAVNNYFSSIGTHPHALKLISKIQNTTNPPPSGGHAFDLETGGMALIEGNVFESVTKTITPTSASAGGSVFNVYDSSDTSICNTALGRACVQNSVSGSGSWTKYTTSSFLTNMSGKNIQAAAPVSGVKASVMSNAGVGHLGNWKYIFPFFFSLISGLLFHHYCRMHCFYR